MWSRWRLQQLQTSSPTVTQQPQCSSHSYNTSPAQNAYLIARFVMWVWFPRRLAWLVLAARPAGAGLLATGATVAQQGLRRPQPRGIPRVIVLFQDGSSSSGPSAWKTPVSSLAVAVGQTSPTKSHMASQGYRRCCADCNLNVYTEPPGMQNSCSCLCIYQSQHNMQRRCEHGEPC